MQVFKNGQRYNLKKVKKNPKEIKYLRKIDDGDNGDAFKHTIVTIRKM